jgi:hypothetical protein
MWIHSSSQLPNLKFSNFFHVSLGAKRSMLRGVLVGPRMPLRVMLKNDAALQYSFSTKIILPRRYPYLKARFPRLSTLSVEAVTHPSPRHLSRSLTRSEHRYSSVLGWSYSPEVHESPSCAVMIAPCVTRTQHFSREPITQYHRHAPQRLAYMISAPRTEPGYNPLMI